MTVALRGAESDEAQAVVGVEGGPGGFVGVGLWSGAAAGGEGETEDGVLVRGWDGSGLRVEGCEFVGEGGAGGVCGGGEVQEVGYEVGAGACGEGAMGVGFRTES